MAIFCAKLGKTYEKVLGKTEETEIFSQETGKSHQVAFDVSYLCSMKSIKMQRYGTFT